MTYDFDTVHDRRGTSSIKWERYRPDVIPLWVADMDFRSPPEVIDALQARVEHGIFGYTSAPESLVQAVLESVRSEFDWEVKEEWLVWLPGLVCGLNVTCRAVGNPGDQALTFTPIYPPFLSAPPLAGLGLVKVPLAESEGRWGIDIELLQQAITPQTRLLMLCNPHNPVGRMWTEAELSALAAVAAQHDLVICSDEIHASLVLEEGGRHLPIAMLSEAVAQRTITLMAPSKTYNIPGLGCSLAIIANDTLRRSFRKAMAGIVPHVNLLGFTAAEACYRHGEPWRRELLEYLRGNRGLVEREVGRMPGFRVARVEATYLAWIDARGGGIDDPAAFFERAGVGLNDGAEFGLPGFVRLNFGCPRSTLQEALHRMVQSVNG
ncbi:MalY/PatB family protein [Geomesophilobacter sediminis]|uniref:cysteine-S-conjugate beta-lyase n=1 Tax=Geomesophilobacter sediminis TaxID=2798584 RepID=A0A8J7M0N6_9BACT|nr:PatB family C-S lyase [Geomesophilobacter sediminis]MBJ6726132.1 PatB family C-S lyase [Geomesophilobacter sediminis]